MRCWRLIAVGIWLGTRPPDETAKETPKNESNPSDVSKLQVSGSRGKELPERGGFSEVGYRGKVDVTLARTTSAPLMRLNEIGALPMRQKDTFRIEAEVNPPAYLYVVWVDPEHDVTPLYPWNQKVGWGSRPTKEEPVGKVPLPPDADIRYTSPQAKPGVSTIVLFARETPLDVSDDVGKGWFEGAARPAAPAGWERRGRVVRRLRGSKRPAALTNVRRGRVGRRVRPVAGSVAEGDR